MPRLEGVCFVDIIILWFMGSMLISVVLGFVSLTTLTKSNAFSDGDV